VTVLFGTDPIFLDHDTGAGHPERPARLQAVTRGIEQAGLMDVLVPFSPRPASHHELATVHSPEYLHSIERFCRSGGGAIDADTTAGESSWLAATVAAGAGVEAIERLDRGEADAAFLAVRPPGHHATPVRAMGFCLINNVAVAAANLAARGERVLIVDWDAHHGNGTQAAFYSDSRVLYVSMHQFPLYPGTGRLEETGEGAGSGTTINFPFPPGTTGDSYRAALDEVLSGPIESFEPTWVLVSAGFDSHRADPLTDLGLSAGDFADLMTAVIGLVDRGRRLVFLEGGYDLEALAASVGSSLAALAGVSYRPERATSGGPGADVVEASKLIHEHEAVPDPSPGAGRDG
jgi:acetoin utilization deacetylase AcuC-like enzyme